MRALAVLERDLRRMLRNPMTLASSVLMPLLYLLILGNSLQGPIHDLLLGVVLEDRGAESRAFVGTLRAVEAGPRTFHLVAMTSADDAIGAVRRGDISGFVLVPRHFSSDVERGAGASVGLYVDNVDGVAAGALSAGVTGALSGIHSPIVRLERRAITPQLRTEEIYPRVDYDTSLVPAVVVMAIFMSSMVAGGFSLVMDRFLGVHESYLSTPLRRIDLALGMLGSGTVLTMGASTLVLIIGMVATGGTVHGGVLGYVALLAVQLLTTLGLLAMMMVVLGRTAQPRLAGVINGFLNVILFFPSGALYPIASFPPWLRALAVVDPESHAIAALKAVLFRNGDLAVAGQHILFLAGFAVVMLGIATTTMKRTL